MCAEAHRRRSSRHGYRQQGRAESHIPVPEVRRVECWKELLMESAAFSLRTGAARCNSAPNQDSVPVLKVLTPSPSSTISAANLTAHPCQVTRLNLAIWAAPPLFLGPSVRENERRHTRTDGQHGGGRRDHDGLFSFDREPAMRNLLVTGVGDSRGYQQRQAQQNQQDAENLTPQGFRSPHPLNRIRALQTELLRPKTLYY